MASSFRERPSSTPSAAKKRDSIDFAEARLRIVEENQPAAHGEALRIRVIKAVVKGKK
jgi:hypothetical protein